MAKIRILQTEFWQDDFVLGLSPEEKFFYSYLLTNTKSNQVGCYVCPIKVMELETGYNRETVKKLLDRFVAYKKIKYNEENSEIYILNWSKYNWNNNQGVIRCILSEYEGIKTDEYKALVYEELKDFGYDVENLSQPIVEEEVNNNTENKEIININAEEKREKIRERNKTNPNAKLEMENVELQELIKIYQDNGFGQIGEFSAKLLKEYMNEYSFTWVKEAMEIAVEKGVRNLSYVNGILKNRASGKAKPKVRADNKYKKKSKYYKPNEHELSEEANLLNGRIVNSFMQTSMGDLINEGT